MRPVEIDLWKARDVARLLSLVEADRRYFQELLAAIPVPIAIVSRDLSVPSCNHAFWSRFESSRDDARPTISEWLEVPEIRESLGSVFASRKPVETESVLSGETVAVSMQPLRHWDEEVVFLSVRPAALRLPEPAPEPVPVTAPEPEPVAVAEPVPEPAPEPEPPPAPPPAPQWAAATWTADAESHRILSISTGTLPVPPDTWAVGGNLLGRNISAAGLDTVRSLLESACSEHPAYSCDYPAMAADGSSILLRDIVRRHEGELHGITIDVTASHAASRQRSQAQRIESLTRLASRLVHDSNNLIMIMSGYGEDLLHALPPESSLRVNVREILAAGERLAVSTRQLNLFTKRAPVSLEAVNLGSFLDEVRGLGKSLPPLVSLSVTPPAKELIASADPKQLLGAVETLIQRAASGLPNGGTITVEVSARHASHLDSTSSTPMMQSCIEIRDTGLAIHPGTLARMFEPDASSDPLRQKLPVVYQSVRDMGGDIEASASFPSGTSFRILLPVAEAVKAPAVPVTVTDALPEVVPPPPPKIRVKEVPEYEPPPPPPPRAVEPEPIPIETKPVAPPGPTIVPVEPPKAEVPAVEPPPVKTPEIPVASEKKTTVLVVDDEAGIRSLLRKVLLREGYHVLEATQGREGLEAAKAFKGHIDLLLTDVVMPEMNGIELARALHPMRPGTKILLISGYMGANAIEAEKLPAGTAFLQKPFTLNALLAKVKEVLGTTSKPAVS